MDRDDVGIFKGDIVVFYLSPVDRDTIDEIIVSIKNISPKRHG
jgi:hypothetical protein